MSINETSAKHRPRRWLRLVGVPLLILLVVALLIWANYGRMAKDRLADAMSAADRDDRHWRLDDLLAHREKVPDAENSARVLAKLPPLLPASWPSANKASDWLTKAAENVRMDKTLADPLRDELEAHDEAVEIARAVANFSRGRHELKLGPTLIDTLLPETEAARSAARLLAADAAIRAHDGDLEGSLDSCRAILNTGRSIGDEPFLISQLVRVAIDATALKSARRALGQGEPSDAALARLQILVMDELAQPLMLHALKGERATLSEMLTRLKAGKIPVSALSNGSTAARSAFDALIGPWVRPMLDHQQAVALEWMNDAVAIARRPAFEQPQLWAAWQAKIDQVRQSRTGRYTAMIPLLLVPATSGASTGFTRSQCDLGATAILIAAERHRRKTGDWPASIAAIDRGILPVAPLDAFSGKPFRMDRRDGQLIIYSIGPNLKDDHGAFDSKRRLQGGPDDVAAATWDVPLRRKPPPAVE